MTIPVFGQIHALSFLIPATVGSVRFARSNRAMRILAVLCVLACLDVAGQLFLGARSVRNYFISDYYRVIETSLLCAVFYSSVAAKGIRRVLIVLGILFVLIWGTDMIWFNNPDQYKSGMAMISRTFVLVMSLMTLQATLKDEGSRLVDRQIFWIAMGAVLYSSGTLLVVGLSNQLLQLGQSYFIVAWHINWALLIIANLFYTKGFLCKSEA
jgi:hypothetical protein